MALRNTLNTLKFITNHPLNKGNRVDAVVRFVKWQISTRLNPYPVVFPYAEKSKLLIWKGLTGATGNLYCGLHEFEDMMFVLHFLRDSDLFIDIGANIGSYTLLGAKEIEAKTISIEPIPKTFKRLEDNLRLNKIEKNVTALNIGLGSEKGELKFTKSLDTGNHVAMRNEKNTINVPVEKFDDIIIVKKMTLVKIDVEGFETEVLKGMSNSLSSEFLKAIIIELNGSAKRYGYDENMIHKKLLSFGFSPYSYSPFKRELSPINSYGIHNTIYLKDFKLVSGRVKSAKKIRIFNQEI